MRRFLAALGLIGLVCWYTRHDPLRQPLGGMRCRDCGKAGADLDDMGFTGEGYVPPTRRTYDRDAGAFNRTSHWDAETTPGRRAN